MINLFLIKKSKGDFHFYKKKAKSENNAQRSLCKELGGSRAPRAAQALPREPPQQPVAEPGASGLYPDLLCSSVSRMCPKGSEKPKRSLFWV